MEHRTFNLCEVFIGVPGTGKSSLALARLMDLYHQHGCYVLIHDEARNLPAVLPAELGGAATGIIRHESIEDCRAQLAADPRGLHAFHSVKADHLIQFAREIAKASLAANGGTKGPPVVVYIDEVVMAVDMEPRKLSPEVKKALTQRRHDHVGYLLTTQQPNMVHPLCLVLSTEVYLFRCPGAYAAQRFKEATVPEEIIAEVQTLPDYEYIQYKIGRPYTSVPEDEKQDPIEGDSVEETLVSGGTGEPSDPPPTTFEAIHLPCENDEVKN